MESEQKNSYLFYFIITLILLGFIASLLPLKAKEYRLSDAGLFMARDTVTDNLPLPATAAATADRSATAY
jgi:hypothetical protein